MSGELEELFEGLEALDWSACEQATDLSALSSTRAVRILRAGLLTPRQNGGPGYQSCSVGLNAGTTFVSFNLKRQARGNHGTSKDLDASERQLVLKIAPILSVMLGVKRDAPIGANEAIEEFARRTGIALCHAKWNKVTSSLRTVFCSQATVLDRLSGKTLWRYSPSFADFFLDDDPLKPPLYVAEAEEQVARRVVTCVWKVLEDNHYIVDSQLKSALDRPLFDFVLAGLVGPGEAFVPGATGYKRFAIHLWGGAGVGKSTFVTLLAKALQKGLRQFVCPELQVNIVKVPLNSVTPDHLRHILRIQGISDWSVERMLEQSVAKENLVLLHLEETPQDTNMQSRLFALVESTVNHLLSKYPERPGSVLFAVTSNYVACEAIHNFCTVDVEIHPPCPEDQYRWACTMLKAASSCATLQLTADVRPPATSDMRPLNHWWLSLGFYASLLASKSETRIPVVEIKPSSSPGKREDALVVRCESSKVSLTTLDGFFFFDSDVHEDPVQCIAEMTLRGYTTPGVVLVDLSQVTDMEAFANARDSTLENVLATFRGMNEDVHVRLRDLGELSEESHKDKIYGDPSEIRGGLFKFIDDTTNPNVPISRVVGDCVICGNDAVCTAKHDGESVRIAFVTACVSQVGQYMLRELLESGERSRTHRTSVIKKHLFFLLFALPGQPLVSQTISRAHYIRK